MHLAWTLDGRPRALEKMLTKLSASQSVGQVAI